MDIQLIVELVIAFAAGAGTYAAIHQARAHRVPFHVLYDPDLVPVSVHPDHAQHLLRKGFSREVQ